MPHKHDEPDSDSRRDKQLARVLTILKLLDGREVTIAELHEQLAHEGVNVSARTVRRDLYCLRHAGVVSRRTEKSRCQLRGQPVQVQYYKPRYVIRPLSENGRVLRK